MNHFHYTQIITNAFDIFGNHQTIYPNSTLYNLVSESWLRSMEENCNLWDKNGAQDHLFLLVLVQAWGDMSTEHVPKPFNQTEKHFSWHYNGLNTWEVWKG
jgi:hypothetical protein